MSQSDSYVCELAVKNFERSLERSQINLNDQIGIKFMKTIEDCKSVTQKPAKETGKSDAMTFLQRIALNLPQDLKDMHGIPFGAFLFLVSSTVIVGEMKYCRNEFVQQANNLCKQAPLCASLLILSVLCCDEVSFPAALQTIISAEINVNEAFPFKYLNKLCIENFSLIRETPPLLRREDLSAVSVAIACRYYKKAKLLLVNGSSSLDVLLQFLFSPAELCVLR